MWRSTLSVAAVTMALVPLAVGCANPADNKPAAEVGEAAPVAAPDAAATVYTIADGSSLTWVGSKVTGSHDGGFNTFSGTIAVPEGDVTQAAISIDIDANSIWSDNERLTAHLKSADFFEVETYPTAKFESMAIVKTDEGYEVTGNLTLHGQTNGIKFPAQITHDGDRVTAQAEFFIKRGDWGINYAGKADDLIRDEVVITFDIVATA